MLHLFGVRQPSRWWLETKKPFDNAQLKKNPANYLLEDKILDFNIWLGWLLSSNVIWGWLRVQLSHQAHKAKLKIIIVGKLFNVSKYFLTFCKLFSLLYVSLVEIFYTHHKKTPQQVKRHKPSLLFTSLTILTSLTFITR